MRTPFVALLLCSVATLSSHAAGRVFVGTWGDNPGDARVLLRDDAGGWTDTGLPGATETTIRDLEWDDGILWVSTGDLGAAGGVGHVYRYDGSSWTDVSPPGGFDGPVADVTVIGGALHAATASGIGHLYRFEGGTTWTQLAESIPMGQAVTAPATDGRPVLYMGSEQEDSFWVFDPEGLLPCGSACPITTGPMCPAGCEMGSCVYAVAAFDRGTGPVAFMGSLGGGMYEFDPAAGVFVHALGGYLPSGFDITALTEYAARLWIADKEGALYSSSGSAADIVLEASFGMFDTISRMAVDPDANTLWVGFGDQPWNEWGIGTPAIKTFDGAAWVDRTDGAPLGLGVSALLVAPAPISITCDAGAPATLECAGAESAVTLDASATLVQAPPGTVVGYEWSGDFLEGTATGATALVHFAGLGDHAVTLTVTAEDVVESCSTTVSVVDTTPPAVPASSADLFCLWPLNHRMATFGAADFAPLVTDACGGAASVTIVGCASDEPEDSTGDGSTEGDCEVAADGSALRARAERQGMRPDGRRYAVSVVATDASGNASAPVIVGNIHVPRDQSAHPADCRRGER